MGRGDVNDKLADPKMMVNAGYHNTIFLARRDYTPAVDPLEVVAKRSPTKKEGRSSF